VATSQRRPAAVERRPNKPRSVRDMIVEVLSSSR
jgi:hypothetical protein